MTKPIPDGYSTLTPSLVVADGRGAEALDFYQRAFGATLVSKLEMGGKLMHSVLRLGDSQFLVNEPFPESRAPEPGEANTLSVLIYVEDCDALQAQAVDAGATIINPVADQFHGDRAGSLRDPFGHRWMLATHTEDIGDEEMQRRMEEAMAGTT
jgi:PhnB protein